MTIDVMPQAPLHPRVAPARLQRAVLAVDDVRNACQPGRERTFEQRSPTVRVHHVRPLTFEQPVEIGDEVRIVAAAPIELEQLHARAEALLERVAQHGAAD